MNGRLASAAMQPARNVLPVPGPAAQEHALGHVAAELLEVAQALQDLDRALGVLEQVGLAAVVLEREADLGVVRGDRVLPWSGQEPEQRPELDDHEGDGEDELDREERRRRQEPDRRVHEPARAVEDDQERQDREHDDEPDAVLVPEEPEVRHPAARPGHRKFTITPLSACTTRLTTRPCPPLADPWMTISVADRSPSMMVPRVSTLVTS